MLPVEYLPLGAILKATLQAGRTRLAISVLCALLIAGPILARALAGTGTLDSDVWFLLATGREIARNGIPRINPFSIWPGRGMVAQQWLHDVWLWAWSARALTICAAVVGMCAASLLNPYGTDGSLYVLKSLGEASYGGAIVEMQPLWVPLGPLFAVPVAAMALGPIALCRRSGAKVPAGAMAMLLAGIAAGVLHSRCMWIAGLSCGLCCAFGLAGALGEPVAHPGRAAAAAGAAMALLAAVSGLAVSLAPRSGGEAGLLSVTESEMSPIFSAIYDAGPGALVFSSNVSVYNQLEWEGFKVPCDMRPEIWGERIAGAGAKSAYRGIVDVLQGSTSLKESTEDWGWELFLVRDDEADTMRSGGHFEELVHGGGYALFGLPEDGE